MSRPCTVYFDTSFYIGLAAAPQEQADEVIREVNRLSIRHVLSGQVILELLTNTSKTQKDEVLVSRILKFQVDPLRISSGNLQAPISSEELSWEILLLKGGERNAVASVFRSIFDLQTEAESWSKLARNPQGKETDPNIQANLEAVFKTSGIESIGEQQSAADINKMLNFLNDMLTLVSELPNGPNFPSHPVDPIDSLAPAKLKEISNELFDRIGGDRLAKIRDKDEIVDSTTATDGRPYKVAAGQASTKEKRKLGNTLRDSNSMSLFVAHQEEIDLLQIDNAQMAMIKNQRNPVHKIVELGLQQRCFSSSGFVETVDTVKSKMLELGL